MSLHTIRMFPFRPVATLAALVALTLLPETAAAQSCPRYVDQDTSCPEMNRCSHGQVAVQTAMQGGNMLEALRRWEWCTEKGRWSPQQWDDDCTRKGWFPVGHIMIGVNSIAERNYDFAEARAAGVSNAMLRSGSTAYCVAHKTNPDYAYYYNGQGFVYSRNRCIQDRDGNGTHETAIWGDDNCSPQGTNPTHTPKWVAPWEWPKP